MVEVVALQICAVAWKTEVFEPKQCSGNHRIFQLLYLELEVQTGHLCELKLMTVLISKHLLNDFFDKCFFSLRQKCTF